MLRKIWILGLVMMKPSEFIQAAGGERPITMDAEKKIHEQFEPYQDMIAFSSKRYGISSKADVYTSLEWHKAISFYGLAPSVNPPKNPLDLFEMAGSLCPMFIAKKQIGVVIAVPVQEGSWKIQEFNTYKDLLDDIDEAVSRFSELSNEEPRVLYDMYTNLKAVFTEHKVIPFNSHN
ncbi:hypothetical protein K7432_006511 [Basidiobolus ranarum]|uniref:Uncharacterized protein n=1 Tax=Basidiobolus ranarum TaxID=34480 RepID=A0ABR2WUT2_9FUNG